MAWGRQGLGPGRGLYPALQASVSHLRLPSLLKVAVSGCSSLSLPVCLSFISEMKLEGKCNLRRPTKVGKIEPDRLPARPRNILLSPSAWPLLPAPPVSQPWARSRGSFARHRGPRGLGGPQGGPEGGREEREGSRLDFSGAPAPRPALPSSSARQSLFLIRVSGAVPARLPSVCKRLTRGPSLNPLGAGLERHRAARP